ncbi:hypothetical protein [Flammeovirga aprica]|uniref:Uncharacterized protein n=1 Tax=Flammeovirga aprica JL-4 TaxID=694437 RepID=A0A7X9RXI4_9BACT|nr:hypothetical protein [Flammeovirga aprica]NME70592.1 hypothetical protein [Flammeovirga aprica JL-4]
MQTREKSQRLEQRKKTNNTNSIDSQYNGVIDLEDLNNYYDKIIKERNGTTLDTDTSNRGIQPDQNPKVDVNVEQKKCDIIKNNLYENLSKYNSIIDSLSNNDLFSNVLDILESYEEYIVVSEKRGIKSATVTGDNGFFNHAEDGIIFPGGHYFNPHEIELQVPQPDSRANGFTESTIFEELFHALQIISKDYHEKVLQIETEAKVAKMFVLYDLAKSKVKNDEFSIAKSIHNKNKNDYERHFFLSYNGEKYDGQLNSIVKKYFDAKLNGNDISKELEIQFRLEVKKLSDNVYDVYKDEWKKKGFKVDKNQYFGETPLFNELTDLK